MEVESKVQLTKSELAAVFEKLSGLGINLGGAEKQKDVYFKEIGFRDKVQGVDGYIVRLRYTNTQTVLNMKRLTTQEGVWTEVETIVKDGKAVEEIIMAIGAEHAVNVTKTRRMARLDDLEIIIDEIEELGTFLELSVEGSNVDVESARKTINSFLESLGIPLDRVEYRGYPTILLEEQGVVFSLK